MGSNYAQKEKSASDVEQKLNIMLKSIEAQRPFSRNNFVSVQKLVFLWIIGETKSEMKNFLQTEIRQIVEDERSIWIVQSSIKNISEEEIYKKFYEGIECASRNYLTIDMDHLLVCPIFLPGCLQKKEEVEGFTQACLFLQQEMGKRHRYLEWSPFILLKDENVDETRRQIHSSVYFMEAIIEDGRKNYRDCCSPGCVISDVNERGQEISEEQKAKIIIMLTVFRNTTCDNGDMLNSVLQPVLKGDKEYFYTARAISICEPVKSLMLNRLIAVHNLFLRGGFSQDKLFDNWKHIFFNGNVWKNQLDKLSHDDKYYILTAPIYSNIPVSDPKKYEMKLRKFCSQYYFEPLMEGGDKLLQEWWKAFWEEYFLSLTGSVESLDKLEENREKIIDKVPMTNVKSANGIYASDLRRQCEEWLVTELKKQQRYLVEKAMKPDGEYMNLFRKKKETLNEILNKLEISIRNQARRMRQTELLLNTGGNHVADPQEEAEHWLKDYINTESKNVTEIYRVYQSLLCEMFQRNSDSLGGIESRLLEIYNEIVAGSIESRESYMKTKLANLAGSDMGQLILKLGESWMYPMRLIGNVNQHKVQRLYVMGSRDNYLCKKMLEQPNYQVAFKENTLDDRLEIVRVSDRFGVQQILSHKQESETSGLL